MAASGILLLLDNIDQSFAVMMLAAPAFIGSVVLSLSLRKKSHKSTVATETNIVNSRVNRTKEKSAPQRKIEAKPKKAKEKSHEQIAKIDPVNGHHFGNFHEYYSFHKCEDRCSALSERFFVDIWEHCGRPAELHLLDIGCNEGDLTHEVLMAAQKQLPDVAIRAVGVDLDDELIERAKEKYKDNCNLLFGTVNVMELGSLLKFMKTHHIQSFALVSCFSITMWIHMNHGDQGLLQFLHLVGEVSSCSVLLEPQLWKSYRKANERCRRRGIAELPHFQLLKIKDVKKTCVDVFTESFGMQLQQNNETPGWNRPLILLSFKALEITKVDA